MRHVSPLRYPGGKARLGPLLADLLREQHSPVPQVFVEPFAGGAGAGLYLLRQGVVDRLVLNDAHPGVAAFWRSIVTYPEEFCTLIRETSASLENWHRARDVLQNASPSTDDLTLGFATFFLNRTNRSGILINAYPIGGLDQAGKYKIGDRYNPDALVERVHAIAAMSERITVTQEDGTDLLSRAGALGSVADEVFALVDPPYVGMGHRLYELAFTQEDHERLAAALKSAPYRWVLTYDDVPLVRGLYPPEWCTTFEKSYSAARAYRGQEIMVFSENTTRDTRTRAGIAAA